MKYYIATEIADKPFIFFQGTDLTNGPLVVAEGDVPETQFGVCPWKIVDGQLVERDAAEMAAFENQYIEAQAKQAYQSKVNILTDDYFTYATKNFPVHDTARLYYSVIERTPGNYKVLNTTNELVDVLEADNAAFLSAYYLKLKEITQP